MRTSKKRKTEKVKKEINGDEETKAVSEVILHSIAHVTSLKSLSRLHLNARTLQI